MVSKVEPNRKPGKPKGLAKSGGRKKGTPNKVTASLKEIAREYTSEAIEALVAVIREEGGSAKVSAAKEILDRGYGKASTVLTGDEDGGPVHLATRIELVGVRPDDNR